MDALSTRPRPLDPDRLVLVVVGAHLAAERWDRPIGQHVAVALGERLEGGLEALVCTDLWYLNHEHLRRRPTVSIGAPDVNALAAFWADKLPSAYTVEGSLTVQMDVALVEPAVSCWGVSPRATALAAQAFLDRYASAFAERAAGALPR